MNDVISTCVAYNAERLERLKEYKKKNNRKIVGFLCSQVPEELIYAAGMLPVRIMGSREPLQMADSLLQSYVCSFSRSCLDLMLLGKYQFLDGIVVPHSCDTIRALYGVIERNVPLGFTHFLKYPISLEKPEAAVLIIEEYKEMKEKLEKFTGKKITDQDIREAIAVYNKNRALLQKLAAFRLASDRRITGEEFLEVALAGFVMDKKDHNILLEKLLKDLAAKKPLSSKKPRLLVAGNVLDNSGMLKIIEDAGADIVWDDLCTGTRYFGSSVDEKKAPLEGLLEHYLSRTYCPCKGKLQRRIDYLLDMVKASKAQGVIMLHQKFCDPHLWDVKFVREEMEKISIPVLEIEYEQFAGDSGSAGGIKTRIQSLIEMIGGK